MTAGYLDEAVAWRDWVLRAVAGDPEDLQIMYGLGGERRLEEFELDWLPGYEGSTPVRVGNAASGQLQLDVYGELTSAIFDARQLGMHGAEDAAEIAMQLALWLRDNWRQPDDGIWEIRGPRQQFVHSKVMAWVAVDRMVAMAESEGMAVPGLEKLRDEIHDDVCTKGFDAEPQHVHAVLRLAAARCRTAADPAGRVSARGRPARGRHDRGGAVVSWCVMASSCATSLTTTQQTGCLRVRVRSLRAASGWSSRWP